MTKISQNFDQKNEIRKRCKGVHCVDLGESFQTHIYMQNLASIQPRTSPLKFAASCDGCGALSSVAKICAQQHDEVITVLLILDIFKTNLVAALITWLKYLIGQMLILSAFR